MMKIKNKKKLLTFLSLISSATFAQSFDSNGDIEVSAKITAGCFLSAQDINFGNLIMPIVNQSTSANMEILCSKGAPYVVNLAYGGVYGSGVGASAGDSYSMKYNGTNPESDTGRGEESAYRFFDPKAINSVNFVVCFGDGTSMVSSNASSYGIKGCELNYDGKYVPQGWNTAWNNTVTQYFNQATGYSYGILSGVAKGEQIKYYVRVPNTTRVWNMGVNDFKATGSGQTQVFPMSTHIDKENNPTHRLSPDIYRDDLNVIVTY